MFGVAGGCPLTSQISKVFCPLLASLLHIPPNLPLPSPHKKALGSEVMAPRALAPTAGKASRGEICAPRNLAVLGESQRQ